MYFSDFTIEDRYEMMKKRQAYFAELASNLTRLRISLRETTSG